jgi:hypothetical protein
METNNETAANKNKGGRPKKTVTRHYRLRVACNLSEWEIIELKAKTAQLTVSEYLRAVALNSHVDIKQKTLPKEVLSLTGTLNHTAANLNQFAKLNNRGYNFNAPEREECKVLINTIEQVVTEMKAYFSLKVKSET